MDCSEFIDRFSEFVDGEVGGLDVDAAESHLVECPSCRRYHDVVDRGRELLRSAPSLEVSEDFHPRLKHRLYHVDDERVLSRGSATSSTTAATVAGMAVIVTAAAWSPMLRAPDPEVELSPIVVSRPAPPRPVWTALPSISFAREPYMLTSERRELWERSRVLLYEYSLLSERYRRSLPITRVGQD